MTSDPVEPDTKDWTWVLSRGCPDCGFEPAAVAPTDVADLVEHDADDWLRRLTGDAVRDRPAPGVWSRLEYGCHIRDVHRIFDPRVHLMLTEDEPVFPNWDQDQTAVEDNYAAQDPAVVADELSAAAATVAATYRRVPDDAWSRRGLRSNGSEFTVATIAIYHLHDIVHHAWDVGP